MALHPFPACLVDRLGKAMRRRATGDLRPYGLGEEEDWGPFAERRPPVIDAGFLRELKTGTIKVLPAVVSLTPLGVVTADGQERPFDVVVAATGFTTGLERLVDAPEALDERGYPRPNHGAAGLFSQAIRRLLAGNSSKPTEARAGWSPRSTTISRRGREPLSQPAKFVLVGAGGYVVNLAVFSLYAAGVRYVTASILSYVLSNALMYLGNRYFTFGLGHERFWATYSSLRRRRCSRRSTERSPARATRRGARAPQARPPA